MSEAERKRRLSYKERRKKWIFIQGVALILVALLIFASVLIYDQLNKEIYIGYQESSTVKYSVKIPKDAPFYSDYLEEFEQYADENGDLWIPSNHAYPTMAATVIRVDLDYQLNMGTPNVDYEYSYRIYAHPEVVDSASKNKFPMPKTVIDETAASITQSSNNRLTISTPIEIDYHHYNQLVKDFEDKMGIRNATENLIITMVVEVIGSSEVFESSAENTYTINVSIPLNENAFDVKYSTSSGQGGDCKILARKNSGNQHIYRGAAITLGGLELIMFLVFIAYVYLTRNHDVNYSIKVQRLLNSYRSFIQRVVNGFDTTGYQLLEIATFKEMLAIRDTIQLPILMSENTDQTKTQFFIPTNTKILYVFEIKVENYDELYGAHPEWIDDSLIKLDAENIADVAEKISAENSTLATDDIPANEQNQVILNLYAEIEKLRRELAASQEKSDVSSSEAVIPASANGSLKFGHFTAGGCVTINYHEMPDEIAIKEAARMIADDLGERLSSIKNSESETTAKVENVEIADTVSENSEPAAMVEDEAPLNDECIADVSDEETVSSVPTPEATRETVHVDLEHVLNDLEYDDEHGYFIDEAGNPLKIQCRRSFTANIIQSDPETVKYYYSELKNYILSFKGVKSKITWRYESFKKGRNQLFRVKVRGKALCLYCALEPGEVAESRYFHDVATAKNYQDVPTVVKIKTQRGLKRAMELVDAVMARFDIQPNPKAKSVDYLEAYPFQKTVELVEAGYVKILSDSYTIKEPKAPKGAKAKATVKKS